jgi:LPXTG-motif cell wall-anchored protein
VKLKKLATFVFVAAVPLATAGVVLAGDDSGNTLVLDPNTVHVGGTFEATWDGCIVPSDPSDPQLVEFTILLEDGNGDTKSVPCLGDSMDVSTTLTAPSQPGTYQVVAASTESDGAMADLHVQMPATGPESASTVALVAGALLAGGVGLAGLARLRRRSI